ncbi:MAG: class I SAM-dependent methyltransferase, partial [Kiloniellales bacterium]|nr:class I SAM-dependent methyltransferase [Kiloniellales bacterium]
MSRSLISNPDVGAVSTLRRNQSSRTLGPVSDLERHLPSEWWNQLFNAVYLKTDGDVVENDENSKVDVDQLVAAANLTAEDRVLDLCCGQGRHCLELARRGFREVMGIDRSSYLIRLARRRAKAQGLAVSFHEGDARKFRAQENGFDCVAMLGNSFGYFESPEDDLQVLAKIKSVLRSRGILAMDLTDGEWMRENFDRRSWEWIDQTQLVCRERSLSGDDTRLISREVIVDAEKGVIADQFYAERLYSRAAIRELLEQSGFLCVRFQEDPATVSARQQDLGMMARRYFLTAVAPEKVLPLRRGAKAP